MKISDLCIKRPVFATVLSLVIMLLGIVSYTRLPVREYPKIDEPVVTVGTTRGTTMLSAGSQSARSLVTTANNAAPMPPMVQAPWKEGRIGRA